jgi:hypothetical protein
VLTAANAGGTNGLTCLLKHGGAQDNKFMVTHPMAEQRCLTSAFARRSALGHRAPHVLLMITENAYKRKVFMGATAKNLGKSVPVSWPEPPVSDVVLTADDFFVLTTALGSGEPLLINVHQYF